MSFTSLISVSFSLRGEPCIVTVVQTCIPKGVIISETQKFSLRGGALLWQKVVKICIPKKCDFIIIRNLIVQLERRALCWQKVVAVVQAFIPKGVLISKTQKFSLREEPCFDKRFSEAKTMKKSVKKNTHHNNKLYEKHSMCSLSNLMISGMTLGHPSILP